MILRHYIPSATWYRGVGYHRVINSLKKLIHNMLNAINGYINYFKLNWTFISLKNKTIHLITFFIDSFFRFHWTFKIQQNHLNDKKFSFRSTPMKRCWDETVTMCRFCHHFTSRFYVPRSQKHKNTVKLSVFFALLGSALVKAALKMLMKLTPSVKFWTKLSLKQNHLATAM